MARKVFFSFHFTRDAWRVSQVRNCWMVKPNHEAQPFLDAAEWEKIQRRGDPAIKSWIDNQLHGTSVTAVLIGAETASRPWVEYEIEQSWNRDNGLLGIRIHNLKGRDQRTDVFGANPFEKFNVKETGGRIVSLATKVQIYDWVSDSGRDNIGSWIDSAARLVGR